MPAAWMDYEALEAFSLADPIPYDGEMSAEAVRTFCEGDARVGEAHGDL